MKKNLKNSLKGEVNIDECLNIIGLIELLIYI